MSLTKGDPFNVETGLLDANGKPLVIPAQPNRARYFYRLRDDRPIEFCIQNAQGPQTVKTLKYDTVNQKPLGHLDWQSYWEGDLLVFYPPESVEIDHIKTHGMFWGYDWRLQIGEPCPRHELERLALNNRVSIIVPSRDA